jgi:hypothetical protein
VACQVLLAEWLAVYQVLPAESLVACQVLLAEWLAVYQVPLAV